MASSSARGRAFALTSNSGAGLGAATMLVATKAGASKTSRNRFMQSRQNNLPRAPLSTVGTTEMHSAEEGGGRVRWALRKRLRKSEMERFRDLVYALRRPSAANKSR